MNYYEKHTGSRMINIHLEGNEKLIYHDRYGYVISADSIYVIISSITFNPDIAFDYFDKSKVEKVNLFIDNPNPQNLPNWLKNFPKLKHMELTGLIIDHLSVLSETSIEYLFLDHVTITNEKNLIEEITSIKSLQYLVLRNTLNAYQIKQLKKSIPKLRIISPIEYEDYR